jgi:hypothetical protein
MPIFAQNINEAQLLRSSFYFCNGHDVQHVKTIAEPETASKAIPSANSANEIAAGADSESGGANKGRNGGKSCLGIPGQ